MCEDIKHHQSFQGLFKCLLRSSVTAVARQQFALKFIIALSFPCWICYWFLVLKSITVILINSFKHIQHVQHPIRIGNQKRAILVTVMPCFGYHLNKTLYNSQENKVRWIQLVQDVTFQKTIWFYDDISKVHESDKFCFHTEKVINSKVYTHHGTRLR